MYKAFEYRIYPNDNLKVLLSKHFGSCRWLYNYGLEKKIVHYTKTKESLSRYDIQAQLPSLKKTEETKWLAEINSQSLQATLIHLDSAYQRFFKTKKGFPQFKNKGDKQSFEIPQHVIINKNSVEIPKFKDPIIAFFHRPLIGKVKTCWIKKTKTGKYFISILADNNKEPPIKPTPKFNKSIGVDVGIKTFAVTSAGERFENSRHFKKSSRHQKLTLH
jgi:putative transposase